MKNKNMKEHQIYQDTRGSTWCPACCMYNQKIHLCSGLGNIWLNIDTQTNIVIKGREAKDVKCTDNSERNNNWVTYYKNRSELYEVLKDTASRHREREKEKKSKERELEEDDKIKELKLDEIRFKHNRIC